MGPALVTHVVDDREPRSMIAMLGEETSPVWGVALARLPLGDYLVLPPRLAHVTIAVERKEVNDLLSSIASGRAKKQLHGCLSAYDRTILLVEGPLEETEDGFLLANGRFRKFKARSLRAWLRARREEGVCIQFTGGPRDTVRYLGKLPFLYEHKEDTVAD